MRSTKYALLVSALFAAAVITALALYVASKGGPVAPAPAPADSGTETPSVDTGRLMPPEDPGTSLYLDADHDLVLRYPSWIMPIRDPEAMAGFGYIPVCDPDHALVCFPYAPAAYEGTNFESAAFSIHIRGDLETEAECLAVQPAEDVEGAVMLGETVFSAFSFGDAAMSHRLDGRNYRAFHAGDCYELATRIATSAFEVWEPGSIREFTAADSAEVRAGLERILMSFRFQDDLELL
ncbi:MAG TPA: hypothetical protein VL283_03530 [Candidatus Baltobacteraceae bacterium]|nr:hypothetical protein [Candidatus Baltobacteraceae bacterium]